MAYRFGERAQTIMFPPCVEDLVPPDSPVRAYDAIINAMNPNDLGIRVNPNKVGCPAYDPIAMLKLLIYGTAYGVRSSRKLERELYNNVTFIWLMGDLKPDHKTIARFRRENLEPIKKVIKETARICIGLGLVEGSTLFVDGSKMRGNAGIKNSWTKEKCEERLAGIDERIEEIMAECEAADQEEEGSGSMVHMGDELADQKKLKQKVQEMMESIEEEGKRSINTTDPDCGRMNGLQGSHAGYNGQIVVDEKEGLIVNSDVVSNNNDLGQLGRQIEQANETLGKPCDKACADAGFADYEDLEKVERQGIEVVVPSRKQAEHREAGEFDKSRFEYDAERDAYKCPGGEWLPYRGRTKEGNNIYSGTAAVCRGCPHFGVCTKNEGDGRRVTRYVNEEYREELAKRYESPEGQATFRKRKAKVELPFGHIKRNLNAGYFLLRGLEGVRAEMSLLATCFNIARLITIFGVAGLIERLGQ